MSVHAVLSEFLSFGGKESCCYDCTLFCILIAKISSIGFFHLALASLALKVYHSWSGVSKNHLQSWNTLIWREATILIKCGPFQKCVKTHVNTQRVWAALFIPPSAFVHSACDGLKSCLILSHTIDPPSSVIICSSWQQLFIVFPILSLPPSN